MNPPHPLTLERRAKLLTQRELARKARISARTVCRIERGFDCHIPTKRKLLKALGLSMSYVCHVFPGDRSTWNKALE